MNQKKEFGIKIAVMTCASLLPVYLAGFYSPGNPAYPYRFTDTDQKSTYQSAPENQTQTPEEPGHASEEGASSAGKAAMESFLNGFPGLFANTGDVYEPSAEKYNLMAVEAAKEADPAEEEETGKEDSEGNVFLPFWNFLLSLLGHGDLSRSQGAEMYAYLNEKEASWISGIYQWIQYSPEEAAAQKGLSPEAVCGSYDPANESHDPAVPATWTIPEWGNVSLLFHDGDGNPLELYSNTKEIISLANVFTYFWDWQNTELFQAYADHLWYLSHQYDVTVGNVYYCDGCRELPDGIENTENTETAAEETVSGTAAQNETDVSGPADEIYQSYSMKETESSDSSALALPATSSDAVPAASAAEDTVINGQTIHLNSEGKYCPGHVDLTISVGITGMKEQNNLFALDNFGTQISDSWKGWTAENISHARNLYEKDWTREYGLTQPVLALGEPLSFSEISDYLDILPSDISAERRAVISCALNSVGKIPYYYGGKPKTAGYPGNHFNTVTVPDHNGRILSGLDCSGWVNWVYRTALGRDFSAMGTYNLVHSGRSISRNELKPGDLLIRLGADAHVVMFLGWNMDGTMIGIHESAGKVNNVTVESMSADWPYYRAFLD